MLKRHCRQLLMTLVLVLALTAVAYADDGVIHTGAPASPPPPAVDGIIYGGSAQPTVATAGVIWGGIAEPLTQVGLRLLQGLLTRL